MEIYWGLGVMVELLRAGCDGELGVIGELLGAGCDGELLRAGCD